MSATVCPICGFIVNGGNHFAGYDTQGQPYYKCRKCGFVWK